MICQACGVEAPTQYVEFHYNIGMLIVRTQKSLKGTLCKTCITKNFREFTLINLLAGWWGVISFFVTPVFLVHNIIQYIKVRPLAPVPVDANRPQLDAQAIQWLQPHAQEMRTRLSQGERIEQIIEDMSGRAGASPGQVQLYMATLIQASTIDYANGASELAPAHPVRGLQNTWTCSVCDGYIRQDATFCKHCRASFTALTSLPQRETPSAQLAPAHPVPGPRASWTCSACGGYVRHDATFSKHCKLSFVGPSSLQNAH